jgi:UDP-N-acetyl-D-mannosaminuronate dehydrogenase
VVGLTRQGFALLARFASRGHRVAGVDPRPEVLAELALGRSGLRDDAIDTALTAAVVAGRVATSGSALGAIMDSDATFLMLENDAEARRGWLAAARTAGIALRSKRGYHLLVIVGDLPPGTLRRRLIPEIERASGKRLSRDFGLCVSPVTDATGPDGLDVLGISDGDAAERFAELHDGLDLAFRHVAIEDAETGRAVD